MQLTCAGTCGTFFTEYDGADGAAPSHGGGTLFPRHIGRASSFAKATEDKDARPSRSDGMLLSRAPRRRRVSPPYQTVTRLSTGIILSFLSLISLSSLSLSSLKSLSSQPRGCHLRLSPVHGGTFSHDTQRRQSLVQFLCVYLHFMKVKLSCLHIMKKHLSAGKKKTARRLIPDGLCVSRRLKRRREWR
jgi:hypothetical protein